MSKVLFDMANGIINKISTGLRNIISSEEQSKEENRINDEIILFDPDNCILCGLCAKHCPIDSIQIHDINEIRTIIRDHSKCLKCNNCIDICLIGDGSIQQELNCIESEEIDSISKELIRCEKCRKPIGSKSYLEHVGNKMSDKIYSNKTLLYLKFKKLGIMGEKEKYQTRHSINNDIEIICPKCRIKLEIEQK
ncbi:MAG: NADH-quinone oxidoreductase subunit I [Candidatus Zixiibacteriota bacterium]